MLKFACDFLSENTQQSTFQASDSKTISSLTCNPVNFLEGRRQGGERVVFLLLLTGDSDPGQLCYGLQSLRKPPEEPQFLYTSRDCFQP